MSSEENKNNIKLIITPFFKSLIGWLKGALPDGRRGWFPSHICTEVKDSSMKRENMKNFMLMEEAKAAYSVRKSRETFDGFPKMKDIQNSDRDLGKIRPR